jgi:hypothetical protein
MHVYFLWGVESFVEVKQQMQFLKLVILQSLLHAGSGRRQDDFFRHLISCYSPMLVPEHETQELSNNQTEF